MFGNVPQAVEGSGANATAPHMRETGDDDGQPDHEAHRTNEMSVESMAHEHHVGGAASLVESQREQAVDGK